MISWCAENSHGWIAIMFLRLECQEKFSTKRCQAQMDISGKEAMVKLDASLSYIVYPFFRKVRNLGCPSSGNSVN